MSERESPKSQVRGSVGDATENKLDGLNHLVNEKTSERIIARLLNASLIVKNLLIDFDVFNFAFLVLTSHELVSFTSTGLLAVDSVEILLVVLVRLAAVGVGAWLNAKHEGYSDHNHDEENVGENLLREEEEETVSCVLLGVLTISWERCSEVFSCSILELKWRVKLLTLFHEVVDHDCNNRGQVSNVPLL